MLTVSNFMEIGKYF
ncbi:hypothetical protein DHD32_04625 [Arenibacter sp. TNZ]|nr:hypothetical protein [Arenibacter sp. TNZ]